MSYTYSKKNEVFKYKDREIEIKGCGEEKIKYSLKDLKTITEVLGIGTSGSKEILCMRILKHIAKELNIEISGNRQELLERILASFETQQKKKSEVTKIEKKKEEFEINKMNVSWNNKTNDFSICDKKQLRKNNILLNDLKQLAVLINIKTTKLKTVEEFCNEIRKFLTEKIKSSSRIQTTTTISQKKTVKEPIAPEYMTRQEIRNSIRQCLENKIN